MGDTNGIARHFRDVTRFYQNPTPAGDGSGRQQWVAPLTRGGGRDRADGQEPPSFAPSTGQRSSVNVGAGGGRSPLTLREGESSATSAARWSAGSAASSASRGPDSPVNRGRVPRPARGIPPDPPRRTARDPSSHPFTGLVSGGTPRIPPAATRSRRPNSSVRAGGRVPDRSVKSGRVFENSRCEAKSGEQKRAGMSGMKQGQQMPRTAYRSNFCVTDVVAGRGVTQSARDLSCSRRMSPLPATARLVRPARCCEPRGGGCGGCRSPTPTTTSTTAFS